MIDRSKIVMPEQPEHGETLLLGVVGSQAYGLATEQSDVDLLGFYATFTKRLFRLEPDVPETITGKTESGDYTLHEMGKYCRLAVKCNPTVLELMWLDSYLLGGRQHYGGRLVDMRTSFLSAKQVRSAYLGYAQQQLMRIRFGLGLKESDQTKRRIAKHARHMARLLWQGEALWQTGELPIQVPAPQVYHDFGEAVAQGNTDWPKARMAEAEWVFDNMPTALPEKPDIDKINSFIHDARMDML